MNIQEQNKNLYAHLANTSDNKTVVSGRSASDAAKETEIVKDIIAKLGVKKEQHVLEIGCGYSNVTMGLIEYYQKLNVRITLMDIKDVIGRLRKELPESKNISFIEGLFPQQYDFSKKALYDRITLYSVLHCSDDPMGIVRAAVQLLKPYGKLLLGDIPNISKKGRFLASEKGKAFEANYRNTTIDKVPAFKDHHDFVTKMRQDPNYYSLIDDEFIEQLYTEFSNSGFDVYILPQPDSLPYCYTRHDIVITKYD